MEPFARAIDAQRKYVVSSTLDRVEWNAELVRGDVGRRFSCSSGSRVRDCWWRREAPAGVGGTRIDR